MPDVFNFLTGREGVASFPLRWSIVHSIKNPDHHPEEEEEEEEEETRFPHFARFKI